MRLLELLPHTQIRVPLAARTKTGIIDELLALLPIEDPVVRDEVRDAVHAREADASTGIGRGVGIPHARTEAVQDHLCAFGVAAEPVEFDSVDDQPCRLFFLCVSHPEDTERHLKLLSELASLLNDANRRGRLEAATRVEDVAAVLEARVLIP